ncbi:MAG: glycosyltransferase family 39 protein [Bryobacterales bacterium]|nr:glycosyltransferase family 39 protein [Bryobacterales bacterium]
MARRSQRLLFLIWLCFVIRLVFYAAVYPMWEGLDEWGHMAYIDHLRQTGNSPASQTSVSGEIAASFFLLPLAPHLPSYVGAGVSHAEYWKLPQEERKRREQALHALRLDLPPLPQVRAENYQAQHPPLAYWLLVTLDRAMGFVDLPSRVFALRMVLVAIASLCLPLLWVLCRRVFASQELTVPACLVLAVMPNFAIYVARVSNDGLAVALMALAMVVFASQTPLRHWALTSAMAAGVAAVASLSKAYGILLIPVYALAALIPKPSSWLDPLRRFALFLAVFLLLAGWWFIPTFLSTGTLSGERLDVDAAAIPLAERLPNLFRVDWWEAWKYGSSSHIWIGGWSFLLLDEWIYWIFRGVGIAAAAGLLWAGYRRWRRGAEKPPFTLAPFWTVPLPLYTLFVMAIAYQGWQIFNTQGASTAVGWYLSSVANAEVVVLVAGLGYAFGTRHAMRCAAALALLLAVLDLFTVNLLSLPYYAGLTSVTPGEMPILSASQWPAGGLGEVAGRLASNHPAWLPGGALLTLWVLYLAATLALIAMAARFVKTQRGS